MSNTNPEVWPYSHDRQQVQWSVLDYVYKVLGRLDDDGGDLMKARQIIRRVAAMKSSLAACGLPGSNRPFIAAPLPREVVEAMLPKLWHRDIDMTYAPYEPGCEKPGA